MTVDELRGLLDGADRMFVDGEFVVLIELQQAAGVGKFGNDLFQHAELLQPAEQLAEPQWIGQNLQEHLGRFGAEQIAVLRSSAIDKVPRVLRDAFAFAAGKLDELEHLLHVPFEPGDRFGRRTDLAAADVIAVWSRTAEHRSKYAAHTRGRLRQFRQAICQMPDVMGVMKVVAHELLDGKQAFAATELKVLGQAYLFATGKHVAGLAGVKVHFVADAKQKRLRRDQPAVIEFGEHSHVVQSVEVGDAAANEPEPAEQMKIAKTAARPLDVRLQADRRSRRIARARAGERR